MVFNDSPHQSIFRNPATDPSLRFPPPQYDAFRRRKREERARAAQNPTEEDESDWLQSNREPSHEGYAVKGSSDLASMFASFTGCAHLSTNTAFHACILATKKRINPATARELEAHGDDSGFDWINHGQDEGHSPYPEGAKQTPFEAYPSGAVEPEASTASREQGEPAADQGGGDYDKWHSRSAERGEGDSEVAAIGAGGTEPLRSNEEPLHTSGDGDVQGVPAEQVEELRREVSEKDEHIQELQSCLEELQEEGKTSVVRFLAAVLCPSVIEMAIVG